MNKLLWCAGVVGFVSYLLWGSGFVSDDFADLVLLKAVGFPDFLIPRHNFINVPIGHFTHHIWFRYFELGGNLVDVAKIFWTTTSTLLIFRFLTRFHEWEISLLIALLFTFHPSHDSIPFWYAPTGHLAAIAVYFEAYSQGCEGRSGVAVFLAALASFMAYSSTPVALALGLLCLIQRQSKCFYILVIPNLIYVAYFLTVSHFARVSPSRFLEPLDYLALLKNFLLQVMTFVDALLGPAFFLKLYFSIRELEPPSILLGIFVCFIAWRYLAVKPPPPSKALLASLFVLALLSWVMFSFTGRYPQLAFNLGNRSTFWGSLVVSYLLVVTPAPKYFRMCGMAVLIFSILGVSDHWRRWQSHQMAVFRQIQANEELKKLEKDDLVLITGNQYSKIGPIAHLEFLSEDWVVSNLFVLARQTCKRAVPLNKHKFVEDGRYQSRKKNRATWLLGEWVWVYDSESDLLKKVDSDNLNDLIAQMELPCRHWSQIDDNIFTEKARSTVYFLMPRLRGALPSE